MIDLRNVNPDLDSAIQKLALEGDALLEGKQYEAALQVYQKAWAMIPEPYTQWQMPSLWLASSMFQAYFDKGAWQEAKHWGHIQQQVSSPNSFKSIFDQGMACFEAGELDQAYAHFDAVYAIARERAFKEYPKKYLEFYREHGKASKG